MRCYKFSIVLATAFALFACDGSDGDETSISKSKNAESNQVESIYELGKCTEDRKGEVVFVTDEDLEYVCFSKKWIPIGDTPDSASDNEESSSSNVSDEKKISSSSGKDVKSSDTKKSSSSEKKSDSSSSAKSSSSEKKNDSSNSQASLSSEKKNDSSSSQASSSSEKKNDSSSSQASSSSEKSSSSKQHFTLDSSGVFLEECSGVLVGKRKSGQVGYRFRFIASSGNDQYIGIDMKCGYAGGKPAWYRYGMFLGKYIDQGRNVFEFEKGSQIYSTNFGPTFDTSNYGNQACGTGTFHFDKTGTWLASIPAGDTVSAMIGFYVPDAPTHSESSDIDYYYFSISASSTYNQICYNTVLGENIQIETVEDIFSSSSVSESDGETFKDPRDNHIYRITTIGTQTWFAQNLNYRENGVDAVCYGFMDGYCNVYGAFYTWEASREVCPTGWHLPDTTEWRTLIDFAGGEKTAAKKLLASGAWSYFKPTDDYGFSLIPTPLILDEYNEVLTEDLMQANLWSATLGKSSPYALYVPIETVRLATLDAEWRTPVRCIKDASNQ